MPGSRGKKWIWILSNARETWINHCVIAHSSPHSGGALFIFPIEKTYFNGKVVQFQDIRWVG